MEQAGADDLHARRARGQNAPGVPHALADRRGPFPVLVPQQRLHLLRGQEPQPGVDRRRHREGRPRPLVAAGNPAVRPQPEPGDELSRPDRAGRPLLGHRDAEDRRPGPRNRQDAAGGAVDPGASQGGRPQGAGSRPARRGTSRDAGRGQAAQAAGPCTDRRVVHRLLDQAGEPGGRTGDPRWPRGRRPWHRPDHRRRRRDPHRAFRRPLEGRLGLRSRAAGGRHPAPRGGDCGRRPRNDQLRGRRRAVRRRSVADVRLGAL